MVSTQHYSYCMKMCNLLSTICCIQHEFFCRSCLLSKEKGEIFKASQKLDELLQKINSTEADKTKYFKEFNVR